MDAVGMLSLLQKAVLVAPEKRNVGTTGRVFSSAAGLLLGYTGIKNFRRGGFALLLPAGYLLWRGASGYCPVNAVTGTDTTEGAEPFEFIKTITIQRNKADVYKFWRKLENLPQIMKHVQKVEKISDSKYKWEVEFNNQDFSWNAEITEDVPNEKISWRSTDAVDVENSGSVEFMDAPGNKGTELRVIMLYKPAKTRFGKIIARFLDPVFKQLVKDDLRQFKKMMESGNIPFNQMASRVN